MSVMQRKLLRSITVLAILLFIYIQSCAGCEHNALASDRPEDNWIDSIFEFDQLEISEPADIVNISKRYSVKLEDLKELNPDIPDGKISANMNLLLPDSRYEIAKVNFDVIKINETVKVQDIAKKYEVCIRVLKKINPNIAADGSIKKGKHILIPQMPLNIKVKENATLEEIAALFNVNPDDLKNANPPFPQDGKIPAGRILVFPAYKNKTALPDILDITEETTLQFLAEKYGVSVEDLRGHNPSIPADGKLHPGMFIIFPERKDKTENSDPSETVDVEDEITLQNLALRYSVKLEDLKKLNPGLPSDGKLKPGMIIVLP